MTQRFTKLSMGGKMKEINRIVIGLVALRLMEDSEKRWYEIFESNKWNRIDSDRLHQLSFDQRVIDWLYQQNNSEKNNVIFFSRKE
jgi:hypothetical protein